MDANNGPGQDGLNPDIFNQNTFGSSPYQSVLPSQQYFPHTPNANTNPNINRLSFGDGIGEGLMNTDFRPENGLFNGTAYTQNQFFSSPLSQFSQSPFNKAPPTPATNLHIPQQLNSRAAELKAKLLKGRASSAAPPSGMTSSLPSQSANLESSSSFRGSPHTTLSTSGKELKQEQNINELISEYSSEPKFGAVSLQFQDSSKDLAVAQDFLRSSAAPTARAHSLGSPTKVPRPVSNGKTAANITKTDVSADSASDMSEGEIFDEPPTQSKATSKEPHQKQGGSKSAGHEDQASRTREISSKDPPSFPYREVDSTRPRASNNTSPQIPHLRNGRQDGPDHRSDKNVSQPSLQNGRTFPTQEKSSGWQREAHDQNREHRKADAKPEQNREEVRTCRETKVPTPTLAQLLPHDENLRDWLEITAYHDISYRDKTLKRHRTLAALKAQSDAVNAQRDALIAEMQAEDPGGFPLVERLIKTAMVPPSAPDKNTNKTETGAIIDSRKPDLPPDRVDSNKRSYSEVQNTRGDDGPSKIMRTDRRESRISQGNEDDYRRPMSRASNYDNSRRPSVERRVDRDSRHYDDARDRDSSPFRRAHDSRQRDRSRGYASGPDDYFNYDDRDDRDPRSFDGRGGYRGRTFDPNYRGRGRGARGRGDHPNVAEPRQEYGDPNGFGSRIANGKPYKDSKGFKRGGKGGTRYFIVKSFNEENVLKCIDDSIWTTQAQNGPIFKEAFETCKNVIFVFSINKSRAFQGYARMESLPGSVEIPQWQKAINWESAGAFKIKWLVICSTRFTRIGHLKNALNQNLAVLIGKDGQEIEEQCGSSLVDLIDEEAELALSIWNNSGGRAPWDD